MNRRILFVSPTSRRGGGGEVVLTNIIRELMKNDYECAIASPFDGPYIDVWKQMGCKISKLQLRPFTGESDIRSLNPKFLLDICKVFGNVLKSLYHILKEFRPRIVYINSFWAIFYIAPISRIMKGRVLWHVHDLIRPNSFNRIFVTIISRNVHQIIAISGAVGRSLVRVGAQKSKITIVHNGIETASFRVQQNYDRNIVRAKYGINAEEFVVLAVGRMIRRKGYDTIIKAVANLVHDYPILRLILLGEPYDYGSEQYMREMTELVESSGIKNRVLFAGWQRDVKTFMAISDVVVSASWAEPFGLSIVEAMASGLPVVATNGGGEPEIVTQGETGILVPPRNEYKLCDAFIRLIDDKNLRKKMGEAGRNRAEAFFSTNRFISNILDILAKWNVNA